MPLNTQFIDKDAVEEICQLDDDFYRNSWITFTYWKISDAWPRSSARTMQRGSPSRAGRRSPWEEPPSRSSDGRAFEEFIGRNPILQLVRSPLVRLQLDMRSMSDSSMPRILAVGNRLVFHEIAYATLAFLDWYDDIGTPNLDEWAQYRKTIKATPESDLFQACDVNILRDGIEAYFLASTASSDGERSRLVLRGNTLLAAYEQWRLEPVVRLSLDPVARNLVTFVGTNLHTDAEMPQAILRNRGTPWAFRHRSRINQWVTERYADLLTQHVLAWEGRFDGAQKNIFLGTGIPDPPSGDAHVVPVNVESNDPITLIVQVFDRSGARPALDRAVNWARYSDRMNFIVHLFRTEQHDRSLFEPPKDLTRRLIEVDLSDDHLDYLRTIGDRPVDVQVARLTTNRGQEPRDFVHELIANNFPADETLYGDKELPGWARNEKALETGRHFFETNGLLIANALFFASLPYSYTAARGSQVLTRSAELTTGNTTRRLAETGQMLRDLMHGHPGKCALTEGTRGFAAARGVRLFHAAVRHMIMTDPVSSWDVDKLGMPVNQEDLLGTLVVFTVVVVRALETMGVDVTSKQGRKEHATRTCTTGSSSVI